MHIHILPFYKCNVTAYYFNDELTKNKASLNKSQVDWFLKSSYELFYKIIKYYM